MNKNSLPPIDERYLILPQNYQKSESLQEKLSYIKDPYKSKQIDTEPMPLVSHTILP